MLGFLNLFSGGALTRFAVFGLGIMPYITSSIIIQLLVVVIPKFEQWRDEGATGQKKLTQTTRYLTIALALMQSTGLAYVFHNGGGGLLGAGSGLNIDLIPNFTVPRVLLIVLTMTAGTAFVMWLGELITQRGIGQGMSILIFANVVSGMPSGGAAIRAQGGNVKFGVILALSIALLVAIVFVEQGQRRIPVTFAKRVVGRRMYGGQSTYIPMKVNTGGVIPIIFASSVLYFPVLLSNVLPSHGWGKTMQSFINKNLVQPNNLVYIVLYGLLIIGFAYFYAAITFDPHQQADDHPQTGRLHPRHPARAADRAPPAEHPQPDHPARGAVPGLHRPPAVPVPGLLEHQPLPVRRDHPAHRRGRGAGDHEADRQPADDAQLRGLPQVGDSGRQAGHPRQAGRGQGDPVRSPVAPLRRAPHLDR